MGYFADTIRSVVFWAPLVACGSTTTNPAITDGGGGSAGETSTVTGTSDGGTDGTSDGGADGTSDGGADGTSDGGADGTSDGATTSSGGTGNGGSGGSGPEGGSAGDDSESTSTTGSNCPAGGPCTNTCPCATGGGACSSDDECAEGLVCTAAAVAKLGFSGGDKSCMPEHCDNDEVDSDRGETSQDCGGECGCRASYEVVEIQGLEPGVSGGYFGDLSGDGNILVGNVWSGDAFSHPIAVSAEGEVEFLETYGAEGSAMHVNDDGSIIVGTLNCDYLPDCADGFSGPYGWSGDDPPARYPFEDIAVDMSSSGDVVVYTESEQAHRLVTSTGSVTYAPELQSATGVSGDGAVVYGDRDDGNDAVWYTETGEVWTPPYPSEWDLGGHINAMNSDGSVFVGRGVTSVNQLYSNVVAFISKDRSFELLEMADGRLFNKVVPVAISADGTRFVGYAGDYGDDSVSSDAVFWDEAGGLRMLHEMLAERGLESLESPGSPRFMSDDGRIIVLSPGINEFHRVVLDD